MKNLLDFRTDEQMAVEIIAAAVEAQRLSEEELPKTASNHSTVTKVRWQSTTSKVVNQGW